MVFKFPAELKEGQLTQQVSASLLHAGRAAQIGAWNDESLANCLRS